MSGTHSKIKILGAEFALSSNSKIVNAGVFLLCFGFSFFMMIAGASMFIGNRAPVEVNTSYDNETVYYEDSSSGEWIGWVFGIAFVIISTIISYLIVICLIRLIFIRN